MSKKKREKHKMDPKKVLDKGALRYPVYKPVAPNENLLRKSQNQPVKFKIN